MVLIYMVLAQALAPAPPQAPQIRVTGRSIVSVAPEQASVDFGVTTEAADAESASRENAAKLAAVLEALRGALGPGVVFETQSYSLHPNYRRTGPREEPVLTGYLASNVIRAEGLGLDVVGAAIDAATRAGANNVQNVAFSLRDEDGARAEALRRAADDARAKARTLAEALGVREVRILTVIEGEKDIGRPMPMYRAEMALAQADAPTPVEPGDIEFRASVTLVVEISQ